MSKKVLFMGTPSYATEILKELLNNKNYEVIGIFTQEDKPVGRKTSFNSTTYKTVLS